MKNKSKNKCPFCGKQMKLICPNEWTMKDEKAYNLGYEVGLLKGIEMRKAFTDKFIKKRIDAEISKLKKEVNEKLKKLK